VVSKFRARKLSVCISIVLLLTLITLVPARLGAQVSGATLTGSVTDPTGAVIPNAKVSIKNTATGIVTNATTNSAGLYTVPNLIPGPYQVTVSAQGFQTELRTGITLTVGGQQALNVALRVGQTTQTISVSGAAPAVQLASSTVSGNVNRTTVVELPLNGRDWTQLATLQPGVATVNTQQTLGVNSPRGVRGYGNAMTISGTRPQENNYRMDGFSINDYSNGAPGSVLGGNLGVDAIQEFSVLTSNYDASYGRTAGGVINAILKSGTNAFHGDAYEFMRNDNVDARNFFEPTIGHFVRNQFGASGGGPIKKDKAFIFGDYEGLRQSQDLVTVNNTVPTPAALSGNLCAGAVTVDPTVKQYLGLLLPVNQPLPPGPGSPGCSDFGTNIFEAANGTSENYGTSRVDVHFSEKDSLSGTWFYDKSVTTAPEPTDTWIDSNVSTRQLYGVEETHIFSPSLVNTARFGYSRVVGFSNTPVSTINSIAASTALGVFPGLTAPGIMANGSLVGEGLGSLGTFDFFWNSFQFYDDAFITKGAHNIKAGFAYEDMQENELSNLQPTGLWSFPTLADFLTNTEPAGTSFIGTLPNPAFGITFPRGQRAKLFGGYVQDDWRARPNLTLNLGLRYEMLTNPYAVHNLSINLESLTAVNPRLGGSYFTNNPTLHNFEPRLGFAYDPRHNGKTAIRGAFGMFDVLPLLVDTQMMVNLSAPFYKFGTFAFPATNPGGYFNTGAGALLQTLGNSALQSALIQPSPPRNYVMTWNLNVQQQLTPSTTLMVGYVGNHEVHALNRMDDSNAVVAVSTPQGLAIPAGGTRINPNWGDIRGIYWSGSSMFNALEASVTKRFSHGFQMQGSYTWSKIIDTGSATVLGDQFINSISSLWFYCNQCRRGVADFNTPQDLVINGVWNLPNPHFAAAHAGWLLGGWQMGGIMTAESGQPTTLLITGDTMGNGNTDPYAFPVRVAGCNPTTGNVNQFFNPACFQFPGVGNGVAPNQFVGRTGRNSIVGPSLFNLDFSLIKDTYIKRISDTFDIQFRAEFFNILNHPSFQVPTYESIGGSAYILQSPSPGNPSGSNFPPFGSGGVISATTNAPRQIQFVLKVIW